MDPEKQRYVINSNTLLLNNELNALNNQGCVFFPYISVNMQFIVSMTYKRHITSSNHGNIIYTIFDMALSVDLRNRCYFEIKAYQPSKTSFQAKNWQNARFVKCRLWGTVYRRIIARHSVVTNGS